MVEEFVAQLPYNIESKVKQNGNASRGCDERKTRWRSELAKSKLLDKMLIKEETVANAGIGAAVKALAIGGGEAGS